MATSDQNITSPHLSSEAVTTVMQMANNSDSGFLSCQELTVFINNYLRPIVNEWTVRGGETQRIFPPDVTEQRIEDLLSSVLPAAGNMAHFQVYYVIGRLIADEANKFGYIQNAHGESLSHYQNPQVAYNHFVIRFNQVYGSGALTTPLAAAPPPPLAAAPPPPLIGRMSRNVAANGQPVPLNGAAAPPPPPPARSSSRPNFPCGEFVPKDYRRGRPRTPQTYDECRNCDGLDPISQEWLTRSLPGDLRILPSGNCTRHENIERLMRHGLGDPTMAVGAPGSMLGGKKRKSKKFKKITNIKSKKLRN
tara:strand:+ start:25 stop:945 length:921 start_codon:yes stop_codon:yes gene_type:complete